MDCSEGTRSRTGVLGPFKSGGFHLALEARVRILPITIVDSGRILPAKGYVMTPGVHCHCRGSRTHQSPAVRAEAQG
ncbi:MAG: 1-acyl-sn-glycerol-3-phosphate acyltransferase [Polyangiaceae bacterium]